MRISQVCGHCEVAVVSTSQVKGEVVARMRKSMLQGEHKSSVNDENDKWQMASCNSHVYCKKHYISVIS